MFRLGYYQVKSTDLFVPSRHNRKSICAYFTANVKQQILKSCVCSFKYMIWILLLYTEYHTERFGHRLDLSCDVTERLGFNSFVKCNMILCDTNVKSENSISDRFHWTICSPLIHLSSGEVEIGKMDNHKGCCERKIFIIFVYLMIDCKLILRQQRHVFPRRAGAKWHP